jgi:hypothetical protein
MTGPSRSHLEFEITPQPDDATCGPACLHAVYRYYGDDVPLGQVIREVDQLPEGGTLAVHLARHAMRRGYRATIYTCDLKLFDPTWFGPEAPPMRQRMHEQIRAKHDPKLRAASQAYLDLIDLGGCLLMEDITPELVEQLIGSPTAPAPGSDGSRSQGRPVIAGLSATWLYRCARERPWDNQPDDVAGEPSGHFVVIHGVDRTRNIFKVADPWGAWPAVRDHFYDIESHRLIAAILLGIVTFDAKLLVIEPRNGVP